MKQSAIVLLLVVACFCSQSLAARKFWTIDFKHTGLKYVTVAGTVYAYTTYEVTNNTGEDRDFDPIFRVETETDKLTYAMSNSMVLAAINAKHGKKFLDIGDIEGTLADGASKQGAAIFFRLDPSADHVKVYITGLTDRFRYQDKDNRKGFQRWVRHIHWYRPGDGTNRPKDPVKTEKDEWIWRSTGTAQTAPE